MAKYERAKWVDNVDGTMSMETPVGKGMVIPLSSGTFKAFVFDYRTNKCIWFTRSLEKNAKTAVRDALKVEAESPEVTEVLQKFAALSKLDQITAWGMLSTVFTNTQIGEDEEDDEEK